MKIRKFSVENKDLYLQHDNRDLLIPAAPSIASSVDKQIDQDLSSLEKTLDQDLINKFVYRIPTEN